MECFVDDGAQRNTSSRSNTLKSGFIPHFPSSEFLWFLSYCVPSTVRRHCDMRVPSGSIYPFACGFRFAGRTGHCDGLSEKDPMNGVGNRPFTA
jgi:hypothetical protein